MTVPIQLLKQEDLTKSGKLKEMDGPFMQIVASNGVFVRKSGKLYDTVVEIDKPAGLPPLQPSCNLKVGKLPFRELLRVEKWFIEGWNRHKTEFVVLLYASPEVKSWKILIPRQKVTRASAKYDLDDVDKQYEIDGVTWYLFGSIHSHGSMSAFFSGTDDHDDAHFDGLHITIGKVDEKRRDYEARYMLHGKEWKKDITDVVDYPDVPDVAFEESWFKRVEVEKADSGPIIHQQRWQGQSLFHTGPSEYSHNFGDVDEYGQGGGFPLGGRTSHPAREMPGKGSGKQKKKKDGRRNKKGKNGWIRHATCEFCHLCSNYVGNGECTTRSGPTTPNSTCDLFDRKVKVKVKT